MKILVFNTGSTSLRFAVINLHSNNTDDFSQYQTLASGIVRGIGSTETVLKEQEDKQTVGKTSITAKDYGEATKSVWEWLIEQNSDSVKNLDAIAHRVVHGGHLFSDHAVIDEDVISKIESLADIAPLHNPPAVEVIKAAGKLLPEIPMVAVFDTVFHRTIPERAWRYGLPLELADRYYIRRYGFHGTSHQYLTLRYAQITKRPLEEVRIITLHLSGGCSATAVKNGKSIDTSMGFTPLEGLMMGKRSGDIDPAIVGYLAQKKDVDPKEIENLLNNQSGLLGISGLSHDTRELRQNLDRDRVNLAFEVFSYRICKYIGAYLAALNGAEAIVFSGGIGENTTLVRELVCQQMQWCGLIFDDQRNQQVIDREGRISTDDSSLHAYVIPTQEEVAIAQLTLRACTRMGVIARETINCLN